MNHVQGSGCHSKFINMCCFTLKATTVLAKGHITGTVEFYVKSQSNKKNKERLQLKNIQNPE